jgi:hypothetical protein
MMKIIEVDRARAAADERPGEAGEEEAAGAAAEGGGGAAALERRQPGDGVVVVGRDGGDSVQVGATLFRGR